MKRLDTIMLRKHFSQNLQKDLQNISWSPKKTLNVNCQRILCIWTKKNLKIAQECEIVHTPTPRKHNIPITAHSQFGKAEKLEDNLEDRMLASFPRLSLMKAWFVWAKGYWWKPNLFWLKTGSTTSSLSDLKMFLENEEKNKFLNAHNE